MSDPVPLLVPLWFLAFALVAWFSEVVLTAIETHLQKTATRGIRGGPSYTIKLPAPRWDRERPPAPKPTPPRPYPTLKGTDYDIDVAAYVREKTAQAWDEWIGLYAQNLQAQGKDFTETMLEEAEAVWQWIFGHTEAKWWIEREDREIYKLIEEGRRT